ncbi:MAG: hypothetical protein Q7U30_17685, partial [Methylicorpusculum sp.]|nr:hypothetical protein [Methylicorpusculum sp.]
MGVAFFIASEREVEGLETNVNGKAFGQTSDKALSRVCKAAGINSLYDYVSQDPEELRELLEDADVEVLETLPEEQWFAPAEGLAWTETLSAYLRANPEAIKNGAALQEDLEE